MLARKHMRTNANTCSVKFILPTDVVLADKFAADANTKIAKVEEIPDGWMGKCQGGLCARTGLHFTPDAHTSVHAHERVRVFMHTCALILKSTCAGLDNGPESTKMIQEELAECKTIIWNGPMGVFEMDKFAAGTNDVAKTLADCTSKGAITIIGGGDSVAAVEKAGLAEKMSHISTGGGASLELLEGLVLPGVAALDGKSGAKRAAVKKFFMGLIGK
jgi:phosphoglycerate kinase